MTDSFDKYAGPIISDPALAIVELVANAWDAYATKVDMSGRSAARTFHFPSPTTAKG